MSSYEPALSSLQDQSTQAYLIPAEAQTQNPRHVRALRIACRGLGVELIPEVRVTHFQRHAHRMFAAHTNQRCLRVDWPDSAKGVCLAAVRIRPTVAADRLSSADPSRP